MMARKKVSASRLTPPVSKVKGLGTATKKSGFVTGAKKVSTRKKKIMRKRRRMRR